MMMAVIIIIIMFPPCTTKVSSVQNYTDGFKTVNYKKKTNTGTPAVITIKQRRQPLIGVRNSASLPIVFK
jgi:hypothetical protein